MTRRCSCCARGRQSSGMKPTPREWAGCEAASLRLGFFAFPCVRCFSGSAGGAGWAPPCTHPAMHAGTHMHMRAAAAGTCLRPSCPAAARAPRQTSQASSGAASGRVTTRRCAAAARACV
jgi:hypothetical protein